MADFDWTGVISSTWNTGGNWSVGGVPQASPPTNADNAILSAASSVACTTGSGSTCLNLTCTGYVGTLTVSATFAVLGNFTGAAGMTLAGASAITLSGNLALVSGMNATYTGTTTMNATSGTKTIDADGVSYNGALTLNGVGGTFQLLDDLLYSGATVKNCTLTNGTLDLNGKTLRCTSFSSSNSNTRVINWLGGTIECTAASGTAVNFTTTTGISFTNNTGTMKFTGTGTSQRNFITGGLTFYNLEIAGSTAYILGISLGPTFLGTITISGPPKTISVTNGTTITYAQIVGNGTAGNLITINSDDDANTFTLTKTGGGFTSLDYWSFEHCIAGVANSIYAGVNSTDAGNNTGIIFTAPPTDRFAVATGNWTASNTAIWSHISGGTAGAPVPTSSNSVFLDQAGLTITSATNTGACLNLTVNEGTLAVGSPGIVAAGAVVVGANGAVSGASGLSAAGSITYHADSDVTFSGVLTTTGAGTQVFTTNGQPMNSALNPEGTGTLRLGSDAIATLTTKAMHLASGTFDANNFNITMGGFSMHGTTLRHLEMGSGTWTITSGAGIAGWNISDPTNMTLDCGTSTIVFESPSAAVVKTFDGGDFTYNNVLLSGVEDAQFEIEHSNAYANLSCSALEAIISFEAGKTQTANAIGLSGIAGKLLTLQSGTPGSTWAIAKAGGGILSCDYVTITDCAPPVGTLLYVGTHSTNGGGNNSRVIFSDPPAGTLLSRGRDRPIFASDIRRRWFE